MKRSAIAAILLGANLALAGCVTSPPQPPPPAPVPPPMAETIPKPPVSPVPLMWQPGHWDWSGSSFVWIPGQYVDAAGHGRNWMSGFWNSTPSGWVWVPAHWV